MRRATILSLLLVLILAIVVFFSLTSGARAIRGMTFGGEPDDNFWSAGITYCRDGIQIAATQTRLSTDGAGIHFSLQLTAASPSVTVALPAPIVQGDGSVMVNNTAVFPFVSAQAPGTPVQITVERWDHGHLTAVETNDNSPNTDQSTTDDSQTVNTQTDPGSVVGDCTVLPTPTATSTATVIPAPPTATSTDTPLPTAASTNTPIPPAIATSTFAPTNTPVPPVTATATFTPATPLTPTNTPALTAPSTATSTPVLKIVPLAATSTLPPSATATATVGPTMVVAISLPLAGSASPRLLAVQTTSDLRKAGGHGQFGEALKVFVPANATGTGISLQIGAATSPNGLPVGNKQKGSVGLGYIYALAAKDAHGRSVSQFSSKHPLLIQLGYDPASLSGIKPATLFIAALDPAGNTWKRLPTTVDTFHHLLTALTTHTTLIQVEGITQTAAQRRRVQAQLALLAAAGAPHVTRLPSSHATVGGVPLDLLLPTGRQKAPVRLAVTGAPGARLQVTFALAGGTVMQTLSLDPRGYAATSFAPPHPLKSAQRLRVSVTVSLGASHYTATSIVNLQPGQSTGPLPVRL